MRLFGLLLLAATLGGCATEMWASAPAGTPGKVFVAGSSGGVRAVWVCPVQGSDEKCAVVDIQD